MQPLREISDNNTSGAGFKGDSSAVELAVVSDVPAMREAEQAFAGIDPDDSVIMSHMEDVTTAKIPKLSPVVFFPARPVRQDTFVSLQSWEGFVVRVTEDTFVARLIDVSEKTPVEEAEFPLADVSEDKDLIQPGAVFYWNIGYIIKPSRQRIRASIIRFRRLPAWNIAEIDSAQETADRLKDKIGWR